MKNKEEYFWTKERILRCLAWMGISSLSFLGLMLLIGMLIHIPEVLGFFAIVLFGVWGIYYLTFN